MRALVLAALALGACEGGSVQLGGKGGGAGDSGGGHDDSGTPETDDTGDDSSADDSGDDSADDTAPPAPMPDYSVWDGSRTFSYSSSWGDCSESTTEFGEEITEGDTYDALVEACPDCERIYEIGVSPDELCEWIGLSDPTYRGLVFGDDWAAVYGFDWGWDGDVEADLLDSDASFDGWTISYGYELDYGVTLEIEGSLTFPELDE